MITLRSRPAFTPPVTVDSRLERALRRVRITKAALKLHNVTLRHDGVPDHRTSLKLDVTSWALLDHIASVEGLGHRDELINQIDRLFYSASIPLTHLVRDFLLAYCAEEILKSLEPATSAPEPVNGSLAWGRR